MQAKRKLLNICNLVFKGNLLRIDNVNHYFAANMALLNRDIREEMFFRCGPIYTKIRDEVPTRYAQGCCLANSLIADGCDIAGHVENSILFRGVKIGRGTIVKNCILMQDTIIEDNVELHYTICDKDVTVQSGRVMIGAPAHQIIIGKGKVV